MAESDQTTPSRRSRWWLAMTFTALVTVIGFIVAVQQFTMKYVWDESPHTRTIGGILYMTLGLIGLYLPFRLIRKRTQFADLSPARQWFGVFGVPLLYVIAFATCIEASMRSQTLILPRPFVPTAVVIYDASLPIQYRNRTRIESRNALRQFHLTGGFGHSSSNDDDVERFHAVFDIGFLRHDRRRMVTLEGETRLLEDGRVEVTIDVDAKERLRFSVIGLDNVVITRDGQLINEFDAQSGKYKTVIVGQAQKDK